MFADHDQLKILINPQVLIKVKDQQNQPFKLIASDLVAVPAACQRPFIQAFTQCSKHGCKVYV